MNELKKLPTLSELVTESEEKSKQSALTVLLNQPPPDKWVKEHPMTKIKYLPIERVEYLLTRIFGSWSVQINDVKILANSVVVSVRLFVTHPLTLETIFNDGVGAMPIQTDKGQGAMDWNFAKANGVQLAAPAAETFAIKDAAEKFGKLFGKDLTRKDVILYDDLYKPSTQTQFDELCELFTNAKNIPADTFADIERVINTKEVKSYTKAINVLKSL
jgi:recombination DNA repair RAD52 pathway protein